MSRKFIKILVCSLEGDTRKTLSRFKGISIRSFRKIRDVSYEKPQDGDILNTWEEVWEDVSLNGYANERLLVYYHDFASFNEFARFVSNQLPFGNTPNVKYALYYVERINQHNRLADPDEDFDYQQDIRSRR